MVVRYNRDALTRQITTIRGIARDLSGREAREILDAAGIMAMGFVLEDYVAKGRGKTGKDGIKWDPVADSTLFSQAKKLRGSRGKLRKRLISFRLLRQHQQWIERQRSERRDDALQRRQEKFAEREQQKTTKAIEAQKEKVEAARRGKQIGVDTGRQINAIKWQRSSKPKDLLVQNRRNSITMTVNIEYAKFFDEKREIMSDKTLRPAERRQDLDDLVEEKTQLIVDRKTNVPS